MFALAQPSCGARAGQQRRPQSRASRAGRHGVVYAAKKEGSGDFITDLVGSIFGKKAIEDPEPAGLKRMTKEEWPDQWPALVDEFADPVEGDEGDAVFLRPLLKQTQLEFLSLALAYDADVHGWSSSAYHKQLDGMGACIILAKTEGGAVVGGYNPKGVLGYGDWRDAISAFLFTWPDGNANQRALKLPKTGGSGMAIIDEQGKGPQFGPEGFSVNIEQRTAKSRLGTYYERRPDGKRTLFTAEEEKVKGGAKLTMLRAYVGIGETAKAASYKPNMLQWQPGELDKIRESDGEGKKK